MPEDDLTPIPMGERWDMDGDHTVRGTRSARGPGDVVRHSHASGVIHAHAGGIVEHEHEEEDDRVPE